MSKQSPNLALRRRYIIPVGAGIALGAAIGAATGNIALGLALGIITGGSGAVWQRKREQSLR